MSCANKLRIKKRMRHGSPCRSKAHPKDISVQRWMMCDSKRQDFSSVDSGPLVELGFHDYAPESKQQSKQSATTAESAPKTATTVLSDWEGMATVLRDYQETVLIDNFVKGQTRTGAYCATSFDRLKNESK